MPQTSRLLYYDLGMAADDDGVVEAFTVIRTTGAAEDDLRVLASRGFVTVLNDDLVSFIIDWSTNNQLRKDRYRPSVYAELLVRLEDGNPPTTTWQPDGNQLAPQYSIGEVSSGKESKGDVSVSAAEPRPTRPKFTPPTVEEVAAYVHERGSRVDPQVFVDYYASKGWMIGKNPMRDWKAACRNAEKWERWQKPADTRNQLKTIADYAKGGDFFSE